MRFEILLPTVSMLAVWSLAANAQTPQNWSRYYPPPVQVAPLGESISSTTTTSRDQDIARASHLELMAPTSGNPQYAPVGTPSTPAPPHRVIQAPRAAPAPPSNLGYTADGAAFMMPPAHGNTHAANAPSGHPFSAAHHLPELPGVENDPSAAGPGRLGVGTHWLKTRPPSHPSIPQATVAPMWKAPYSYGYFGSPSKRHWTRQNGYRDRSMQWTLR